MNAGAWVARRRRAPFEPVAERRDSAPRFSRFAAAMEATPPPSAQVLPEAGPLAGLTRPVVSRPVVVRRQPPRVETPAPPAPQPTASVAPEPRVAVAPEPKVAVAPQVVPRWEEPEPVEAAEPPRVDAFAGPPPVIPRRPVAEETGRGDIPWLGICSWLLLCGALFASLVGWPGQSSLSGVTAGVTDSVERLWARTIWGTDDTETPGPDAVQSAALPDGAQGWTALPRTSADPQTLPPTELAPPIAPTTTGRTVERIPGGPPLPQFKPIVDGVAAKFSNAFFEMGDRLQQEGNTDAAVHMRRQGSKLDPWREHSSSDL